MERYSKERYRAVETERFLAGKMTVQERKTVKKDSNERKEEFSVNFETTFFMDWNREGANHSVGRVQCPPAGSWREDRM